MPRSPFEVLEISPDADLAMVDAAWRALARRFHPDANPGVDVTALTARMAEVNWARDELVSGLEAWRRKARRATGGLNWGPPPGTGRPAPAPPPLDLTPRPRPRAQGNGLRWQPAPDPKQDLPPLTIGRNQPRQPRKATLDWQARRSAPRDEDVWVPRRWQEWRAQQKAAEAAGEPVAERPSAWRPAEPAAPARRGDPPPAVEVTPRTLHLPGIAGARASFVARVPGHPGAHIQCRFRDGLVEVHRRGSSGDGVLFEVVVPLDITRTSAVAMQAGIDVLAPGAETTRVFVALEPVVRDTAPRHAEDLLNPRISRLRWV